MKKTWMVGLVLCALFNFGFLAQSTSACIGADGKPIESVDGDVTNCVELGGVEEEQEVVKLFEVSETEIDFGFFTELGRSYTKTFVIKNNSSEPIAVRLSAIEPEYEGLKDENKVGAGWIAFVGGIKYFEIPANTVKTVGIRAVVPVDAKAGSQYAQIKVENVTAEQTHMIDVRMGVSGDDFAFGGGVETSNVAPVNLSDNVHANVTVKNSGNAGFMAKYNVRVTPKFGLENWKTIVDGEQAEVYPGSKHDFSVGDDAEAIGYGLFTVEQKIVYVNDKGEQIEEAYTRTVLNMPWWALIVLGGLIVLIILVTIIVKVVRRKKHGDDDSDDEFEDDSEEEKPKKKAKKEEKEKAKKEKKAKKAAKGAKVEFGEDKPGNEDGLGAVRPAKGVSTKKERKVVEVD